MEPQKKFDHRVKELFDERELQPTKNSWDRLESRLETTEKQPTRRLWWVGAAAALILVFFLIGNEFLAPAGPQEVQVAEENKPVLPHNLSKEASEETPVIVSEGAETPRNSAAEKGVKNAILDTSTRIASEEKPAKNVIFETAAEKTSEEIKWAAKISSEEKQNPGFQEKNQIAITSEDENFEAVSDLEVEALLLLATAELKKDPEYTVNAEDLLQRVEFEIDQSFREKVFEKLRDKFEKAKTAVANGNF